MEILAGHTARVTFLVCDSLSELQYQLLDSNLITYFLSQYDWLETQDSCSDKKGSR